MSWLNGDAGELLPGDVDIISFRRRKRREEWCRQCQCQWQLPAAVLVVLLVLVLVLELGTEHGARERADDAVAAHLVATEVARGAASQRTHESAVALGLGIGVGSTVLALLHVLGVLALGILILRVGALLGELMCGCLARVRLLAVGAAAR